MRFQLVIPSFAWRDLQQLQRGGGRAGGGDQGWRAAGRQYGYRYMWIARKKAESGDGGGRRRGVDCPLYQ
jgi:hypothetical protein